MADKVVEVTGAFVGSVKLQVKVANAFVQVGLPIDGATGVPAVIPIPVSAEWLRVDVTGLTSGTPICVLRGLDTRAD